MNIEEESELILMLAKKLNEHVKEHEKFKTAGYPKQTASLNYVRREIVVLRAELNDLSKNMKLF